MASGRTAQDGSPSYVYFVHAPSTGMMKIGRTTRLASRLSALQSSSPVKLALVGLCAEARADEATIHRRFAKHRRRGEWFEATPEILAYALEVSAADGRQIASAGLDLWLVAERALAEA